MNDLRFLLRTYLDWSDRLTIVLEWMFVRPRFQRRVAMERRFLSMFSCGR